MNVIVARAAIIFAGVIIAGAFLNLLVMAAVFTVGPLLGALGLKPEQELALIYWPSLAAGIVGAFFLMRPAWKAAGKTAARKTADKPKADESISN